MTLRALPPLRAFPSLGLARLLKGFLIASGFLSWVYPGLKAQEVTVLGEQIGVEVVNVDVVVTDRKGRVVPGLTVEDFELRVDGREVPIANFYAATGTSRPKWAASGTSERASTVAGSGSVAGEPLHMVVFLDDAHLLAGGRRRVLEDLPPFLERQIEAGHRVLLAAGDRKIELLTPFTRDLETLRQALQEAAEMPAWGIRQRSERASALRSVREVWLGCEAMFLDPCQDCFGQMLDVGRAYGQSVEHRKQGALAGLTRLVGSLGTIEGRKALIYVSDGLAEQGGLDLTHYVGELCPARMTELSRELMSHLSSADLREVAGRANANRVVIYTLEAAGLRGYSAASVEFSERQFVPSSTNDRIRIANLQSTLFFLADETGGKAILNANRFQSDLDRVTGELEGYYSLGYRPDHPAAGRTHRIGVRVPGRKAELRFRRSFLHKPAEEMLAERTLGALLFGVETNPLAAEIGSGASVPAAPKRHRVTLEVGLPVENLTLLEGDDGHEGRLKVIVAAPDEEGRRTAVRKQVIDVHRSPDETEPFRFGVHVDLPAGSHRLGVGIWDELAGSGSFVAHEVVAGEAISGDGIGDEIHGALAQ